MTINHYGLTLLIATIVAVGYLVYAGLRLRLPQFWRWLFWLLLVIPIAVFGARLWTFWFDVHTRTYIQAGATFPLQIGLFFGFTPTGWRIEGLSLHGALLFGGVYVWLINILYSQRFQISVWLYFDLIIKAVLIAQIIGRWGNFFEGELFGEQSFTDNYPTEFGWIPEWFANKISEPHQPSTLFHPLFLYESLAHFGLLVILIVLPRWRYNHTLPWLKHSQFAIDLQNYRQQLAKSTLNHGWWWRCWKIYRFKQQLRHRYYANLRLAPLPAIRQRSTIWSWIWFGANSAKSTKLPVWTPLAQQWHQANGVTGRLGLLTKQIWKRDSSALTSHFGSWWKHYRVGNNLAIYMFSAGLIRWLLQPMRQANDQMPITMSITIAFMIIGAITLYWTQWLAPNRIRSPNWRYEVHY